MLDHLAELLRTHVLKKEKKLLEEQLSRAKGMIIGGVCTTKSDLLNIIHLMSAPEGNS
jgi:hypothetical protein